MIRKTTEGLTECWREAVEGSWGLRVFGSRDDLSVLLASVVRSEGLGNAWFPVIQKVMFAILIVRAFRIAGHG